MWYRDTVDFFKNILNFSKMKMQYLRKTKLDLISRRLEISEEKMREFEDIAIKTTQNVVNKMTWQKRRLLPRLTI